MIGDNILKTTKTRLAIALALCFSQAPVHALSFSDITVTSALNDPLNGVLSIELDSNETLGDNELEVKLASKKAHSRAGLPYPQSLRNLQIEPEQDLGRTIQFHIFTKEAIKEPIISLILEAEWDSGNLKKEITLLLDPADYAAQLMQANSTQSLALAEGDFVAEIPSGQESGYLSAEQSDEPIFLSDSEVTSNAVDYGASVATDTPIEDRRQRRKIQIQNGQYGPVRSGDSLSKVAIVAAKQTGFSVKTMMNLIYEANPEAFVGSQDHLIRGATLFIPGLEPAIPLNQPNKKTQTAEATSLPAPIPATQPRLTIVAGDESSIENTRSPGDTTPETSDQNSSRNSEGDASEGIPVDDGESKEALSLEVNTLKNENLVLQNKLSNTHEELGKVRNELDRLVVELRALSEIRSLQTNGQEPSLADQIERWLPWLLLFLTLPVALLIGTRGRKTELAVGAPASTAPPQTTKPKPIPDATLATIEPAVTPPPETIEIAPPIPDEVFEEPQEPVPVETPSFTTEIDDTLESDISPMMTSSLLDSEDDDLAELSKLAELDDEPQTEASFAPEEKLNPESSSLLSSSQSNDTQEVIRATLGQLEATQLINPGEVIRSPETSLDATQEAEIYIAYDQFALAEKTINRLLEAAPDNEKYQLLQLKLFAETGNMSDLQSLSVKMLHKHPDPDSEINQRIRGICDRAFTQTDLKQPKITARSTAVGIKTNIENLDNETIVDELTAETLFVDGIEDYIDDDTLSDEDQLVREEDPMSPLNDLEELNQRPQHTLGSLTTELPQHLVDDLTRSTSRETGLSEPLTDPGNNSSLLDASNAEATLSEGLDLPFDLESEILKYESELKRDLDD